MASVAMKGCTLKYCTMTPATRPKSAPNPIMATMLSHPFTPRFMIITRRRS